MAKITSKSKKKLKVTKPISADPVEINYITLASADRRLRRYTKALKKRITAKHNQLHNVLVHDRKNYQGFTNSIKAVQESHANRIETLSNNLGETKLIALNISSENEKIKTDLWELKTKNSSLKESIYAMAEAYKSREKEIDLLKTKTFQAFTATGIAIALLVLSQLYVLTSIIE